LVLLWEAAIWVQVAAFLRYVIVLIVLMHSGLERRGTVQPGLAFPSVVGSAREVCEGAYNGLRALVPNLQSMG